MGGEVALVQPAGLIAGGRHNRLVLKVEVENLCGVFVASRVPYPSLRPNARPLEIAENPAY